MNNILEELNKLNKEEIEYILFILMTENKIEFESLNKMYVKYLEHKENLSKKELGLFSNCLCSHITGLAKKKTNISFFESQAYILLKDRLDKDFFNEYLTNRTDDKIKQNEMFLK